MKFKILNIAIVGFFLATSPQQASATIIESIGVNFYNDTNHTYTMLAANQSAGVVGQTNWNNETFSGRFDSNVAANTGTVLTVYNNAGAVETGFSYVWSGANNAWGSSGSTSSGNTALFGGYFEGDYVVGTGPNVSVTGVNYSIYDVYVYLADSPASVSIFNESYSYTTSYNSFATQGFLQANSNGDLANYALFSGLTSENFQIDFAKISGNRAGIAGFQIVDASVVPEPSTLAILALGLMGLVSRRFNKKS
jgi:hypothetical protein